MSVLPEGDAVVSHVSAWDELAAARVHSKKLLAELTALVAEVELTRGDVGWLTHGSGQRRVRRCLSAYAASIRKLHDARRLLDDATRLLDGYVLSITDTLPQDPMDLVYYLRARRDAERGMRVADPGHVAGGQCLGADPPPPDLDHLPAQPTTGTTERPGTTEDSDALAQATAAGHPTESGDQPDHQESGTTRATHPTDTEQQPDQRETRVDGHSDGLAPADSALQEAGVPEVPEVPPR